MPTDRPVLEPTSAAHDATRREHFDEPALPTTYGEDIIVVQVRDPRWLHAYWEVTSSTRQKMIEQVGPERLESSHYVLRVHDVTELTLDSPEGRALFDMRIDDGADNWYIRVDHPERSYRVDLGLRTEGKSFLLVSRSNVVTTPREGISHIVDEKWMTLEAEYSRLYRLAAGYGVGDSSIEILESVSERHRLDMGSEAISSLFSPMLRRERPRPFWLTVETEFIVYGSTETDATVTIHDQPVRVRSDGSFSARFALPEGEFAVPVKATSADGRETREVAPVVSRRTM